jgi:hypothetical protein
MVAARQVLTMMTGWNLSDDLIDYAARVLLVRALLNQSITSGDLDGLLTVYEGAHATVARGGPWMSPEYAAVLEWLTRILSAPLTRHGEPTGAARQTKLSTIISYHQYVKDVNTALLQNLKLAASLLGKSQQHEMAHIIFGILALSYRLHQGHLTDCSWGKADEATITHVIQEEGMRRHWEQNKHTYKQEFVRYIDGKLRELDREKQLSSNANNQPSTHAWCGQETFYDPHSIFV